MPKIRRQNLPPALYTHLLDRVQQRNISAQQLRLMLRWMHTQPEVPSGQWFKRFPELILCREGELIKTFLLPSQAAIGQEIPKSNWRNLSPHRPLHQLHQTIHSHCALCRSAWSTKTSAVMASTMGTARGRTQGSCRPRALMVVFLNSVFTVSCSRMTVATGLKATRK